MVENTGKKNTMKRVCAWCNNVMQEGTEPATHGICRPCAKQVMESYEKRRHGFSPAGGEPAVLRQVPLMI